jgi:hypothetical protein
MVVAEEGMVVVGTITPVVAEAGMVVVAGTQAMEVEAGAEVEGMVVVAGTQVEEEEEATHMVVEGTSFRGVFQEFECMQLKGGHRSGSTFSESMI